MSWLPAIVIAGAVMGLILAVMAIVAYAERTARAEGQIREAEQDAIDARNDLARREEAAREVVRDRTDGDVDRRLRDGTF